MKPKKQVASDIYDRQIRLWGSDAQVSVFIIVELLSRGRPFIGVGCQ
jgi:hypothetical protein